MSNRTSSVTAQEKALIEIIKRKKSIKKANKKAARRAQRTISAGAATIQTNPESPITGRFTSGMTTYDGKSYRSFSTTTAEGVCTGAVLDIYSDKSSVLSRIDKPVLGGLVTLSGLASLPDGSGFVRAGSKLKITPCQSRSSVIGIARHQSPASAMNGKKKAISATSCKPQYLMVSLVGEFTGKSAPTERGIKRQFLVDTAWIAGGVAGKVITLYANQGCDIELISAVPSKHPVELSNVATVNKGTHTYATTTEGFATNYVSVSPTPVAAHKQPKEFRPMKRLSARAPKIKPVKGRLK